MTAMRATRTWLLLAAVGVEAVALPATHEPFLKQRGPMSAAGSGVALMQTDAEKKRPAASKLPRVAKLLHAPHSLLKTMGSHVTSLEERLRALHQQNKRALAERKSAYEGRLRAQAGEIRAVLRENKAFTSRIRAVRSSNAALRGEAARLTKSNARLRSDLDLLKANLSIAQEFVAGALRDSDAGLHNASALQVLTDLDEKEAARAKELAHARSLSLVSSSSMVAMLEVGAEEAPASTSRQQAQDLLRELASTLEEMTSAQNTSLALLAEKFDEMFQAGEKRHEALLEEHAELNATEASEMTLHQRLSAAVKHLKAVHAQLKRQTMSLRSFLEGVGADPLPKSIALATKTKKHAKAKAAKRRRHKVNGALAPRRMHDRRSRMRNNRKSTPKSLKAAVAKSEHTATPGANAVAALAMNASSAALPLAIPSVVSLAANKPSNTKHRVAHIASAPSRNTTLAKRSVAAPAAVAPAMNTTLAKTSLAASAAVASAMNTSSAKPVPAAPAAVAPAMNTSSAKHVPAAPAAVASARNTSSVKHVPGAPAAVAPAMDTPSAKHEGVGAPAATAPEMNTSSKHLPAAPAAAALAMSASSSVAPAAAPGAAARAVRTSSATERKAAPAKSATASRAARPRATHTGHASLAQHSASSGGVVGRLSTPAHTTRASPQAARHRHTVAVPAVPTPAATKQASRSWFSWLR